MTRQETPSSGRLLPGTAVGWRCGMWLPLASLFSRSPRCGGYQRQTPARSKPRNTSAHSLPTGFLFLASTPMHCGQSSKVTPPPNRTAQDIAQALRLARTAAALSTSSYGVEQRLLIEQRWRKEPVYATPISRHSSRALITTKHGLVWAKPTGPHCALALSTKPRTPPEKS